MAKCLQEEAEAISLIWSLQREINGASTRQSSVCSGAQHLRGEEWGARKSALLLHGEWRVRGSGEVRGERRRDWGDMSLSKDLLPTTLARDGAGPATKLPPVPKVFR
ncbi:hypothetical protein PoB_001374600 [Plakobranchus ocellatus]|uniref:Uncharacterized protein n=1 Tax=Plakobranchus ocellatus TaxID=259542 RepID=A0AAV3YUY5_9GAST|nr:hypothetical protein PoB_001374600 [Plakobranchus ocellatus]